LKKILIVTSEYPTKSRQNDVPWLREQVTNFNRIGLDTTVYRIPNESIIEKFKATIGLRKLIKKRRFSLIHCHWGYNTIIAYNSIIPIITTFHGSDLQGDVKENGSRTIKGYIIIFLSRVSTLLSYYNIFVSARLARSIPRKALNKKNIIIPMGYDSKLFKPIDKSVARDMLSLDLQKKYVLFAGNYSKFVKGYPLAMKVINSLDESYELIKLDYASYKEMAIYMNASDVLLMTSYQEGAPVIIKEALACNLSVISTDVGDVKEIIKFVPGSFVSKERDPGKIANLITRSIEMDSTSVGSQKMGKYTAKKMNNRVLGTYLDLLQKSQKFND